MAMKTNKKLDSYTAFTGGNTKTPDFVIFYNMAEKNIGKICAKYSNQYKNLERKFKGIDKSCFDDADADNTLYYSILADFLWKASNTVKNSNGYISTTADKMMIKALVLKMLAIRNYHSHIWHDNTALAFTKDEKDFIEAKFNYAKNELSEEYYKEAEYFNKKRIYSEVDDEVKYVVDKPFFKKVPSGSQAAPLYYITQEGRVFFLSFFLTRGQMRQFLQMRSGFKRNDLKLYRFKLELYTYYTHREGASRFVMNVETDKLADASATDKMNLLQVRHAYKLISYLNDYPEIFASAQALKLPAIDGSELYTVQQLVDLAKHTGVLTQLEFKDIKIKNKDTQVETLNTRTIAVVIASLQQYTFSISFDVLFKLVVLAIQYPQENIQQRLLNNLSILCQQRSSLFNILNKPLSQLQPEDFQFLLNKDNQDLRASRSLTEKGISFFTDFAINLSGWKNYDKNALPIRNAIRPSHNEHNTNIDDEAIPPERIIIHPHDFIEKHNRKLRRENQFMHFAVRYFMDFFSHEGWYWEMQYQEPDETLKHKIFFTNIWNEDATLRIVNDNVTFAIPKHNGVDFDARNFTKSKDYRAQFYTFNLNRRAVKYLFALLINTSNSSNDKDKIKLSDWLADIKSDMDVLHQNGTANGISLKVFQSRFLPNYLHTQHSPTTENVITKIGQRWTNLKAKYNDVILQADRLNRAQLNQHILDMYKLYSWPVDKVGAIKYFRKEEYKQMSICHYAFPTTAKKSGTPDSKAVEEFNARFSGIFNLNNRKPALPSNIFLAAQEADSLLSLLKNNLSIITKDINEKVKTLVSGILPHKHKKELLIELCHRLSVEVPKECIKEEHRVPKADAHKDTLEQLPILLHPVLILNYFQNFVKIDGFQLKEPGNAELKIIKLFNGLRNNRTFAGHLHLQHYVPTLPSLFSISDYKKVHYRIVATINDTHTEDVILWHICMKYIHDKNPYTADLALSLSLSKDEKVPLSNMFNHIIKINVTNKLTETKALFGAKKSDIPKVMLRLHQVDDWVYIKNKDRMEALVLHLSNRLLKERDFWNVTNEWLNRKQTEGHLELETNTANGSISVLKIKSISYELLKEEAQLIAMHARYAVQYILEWESSVLNKKLPFMDNIEQKQDFLMMYFKENILNKDELPHIDFPSILKFAGIKTELAKKLKDLRDRAFHDNVPITASFAYQTNPSSEIGSLLHIPEPIHLPKDKSIYESK